MVKPPGVGSASEANQTAKAAYNIITPCVFDPQQILEAGPSTLTIDQDDIENTVSNDQMTQTPGRDPQKFTMQNTLGTKPCWFPEEDTDWEDSLHERKSPTISKDFEAMEECVAGYIVRHINKNGAVKFVLKMVWLFPDSDTL